MNVGRLADIDRDRHARARDFEGARLRLADLRPMAVGRLLAAGKVIRELHKEERELRLVARHVLRLREFVAPREDHRREKLAVEIHVAAIVRPRIALALIPQRAADRVRRDRCDHAVEKTARCGIECIGSIGRTRRTRTCRQRLALGFRLFRGFLVRGELLVVFDFRGGIRGELLLPVLAEARVRLHPALGNPRLDRSAAPRGVDEADGHFQFLMQLADEEISDRAEVARSLRRRDFPLARAVVERRRAAFLRHGEDADVGELRACDFLLGVVHAFQSELHVRLPARHPHFADGDILHVERIFSGDGHLLAGARLETFELHAPLAVLIGRCGGSFAIERDGHFFTGIGRAPDVRFRVLEQHHVVADERGEFHIGKCRDRATEECREGRGELCFHRRRVGRLAETRVRGKHGGYVGGVCNLARWDGRRWWGGFGRWGCVPRAHPRLASLARARLRTSPTLLRAAAGCTPPRGRCARRAGRR